MEEPQQGSHNAEDRSAKTAEALRALREGLGSKLETHRRRISDLETDLTSRVLQIAEELAQEQSAESQAESQLHEDQLKKLKEKVADRETSITKLQRQLSDAELKQLRLSAELAEARSAIEAVRVETCQDCTRLRSELATAQARAVETEAGLQELAAQVAQSTQELANSQQALEALRAAECQDCSQLRSELAESQGLVSLADAEVQSLKQELDQATAELANSRQALEALRTAECEQCTTLRDELGEAKSHIEAVDSQLLTVTDQAERSSVELAKSREELAALRESESAGTALLRSELTDARDRSAAAESQAAEFAAKIEQTLQDLEKAQQEVIELRDTECTECMQLRGELTEALQKAVATDTQFQGALAEAQTRYAATESDATQLAAELKQTAKDLADARRDLSELREAECSACAQLRGELTETLQKSIGADNRLQEALVEVERARTALAESQTELDALRQTDSKECGELRSQLAALEGDATLANDSLADLEKQVDRLSQELAKALKDKARLAEQLEADADAAAESRNVAEQDRQTLINQLGELIVERDALAEQLDQIRAELTARDESDSSELVWLEKECESAEQARKQLASDFEDLLKEHKSSEESLRDATLQTEQARALLQKAEERIVELSDSTEHEEALEQSQRKFELALADAQKVKRENADLQRQLAERPEKSETESPELVSLRVERDALATRVSELEANPVQAIDENAEQELSDLRRRFELAVEDLRNLKQQNAQLQDKLAHAPQTSGSPSGGHSTAMDWQSQKARLLAALESEDAAEETAERRQEITTIEGTISITDRVVAEKDREIADLLSQLAKAEIATDSSTVESDFLNKDEMIAAERAKVEALQKELHNKLRTAELEMSVQRAALARRESEIQQKINAAEQARADSPVGTDGKPRRKWLSALGLKDDEEK